MIQNKKFYLFWGTQALSQLGSSMTSFALMIYLFQQTGSALQMGLLSVCSYLPYVLLSVFAGALSDRLDQKKTILWCDSFAALSSLLVLVLLMGGRLVPWHLYVLNALNGLMNTLQNPASEVAITLLTSKEEYQKIGGLQAFSRSLNSIVYPILATALYSLWGIEWVIGFDLATFLIAFLALFLMIKLPKIERKEEAGSFRETWKTGLRFLKGHRLVLDLFLFLAGVNFVATSFDIALPAMILPKKGEEALGLVTSFGGAAMVLGSLAAAFLPKPKDRVKVIVFTMFFSLTLDNFLISTSDSLFLWAIAQMFGYFVVPIMNANLDVVVRSSIPIELQGRVYACRNSFQFFTIPIATLLSGWLIDQLFDPIMASYPPGSGAALLIFLLGIIGGIYCLIFWGILKKKREGV